MQNRFDEISTLNYTVVSYSWNVLNFREPYYLQKTKNIWSPVMYEPRSTHKNRMPASAIFLSVLWRSLVYAYRLSDVYPYLNSVADAKHTYNFEVCLSKFSNFCEIYYKIYIGVLTFHLNGRSLKLENGILQKGSKWAIYFFYNSIK